MKKYKKKIIILLVLIVVVSVIILLTLWQNTGRITKPEAVKINETTYQFTDGLNVANMYLLLGSEKALLIDTGNGLSDLPQAIGEITDLPLTVVNTHGHYDHIHGNYLF